MNVVTWLKGKKTYIVATIGLLTGIVQIIDGNTAGGWSTILQAGAVAGLRDAVNSLLTKILLGKLNPTPPPVNQI